MKKIDIHCHTTIRALTSTVYPDASLRAIAGHCQIHEIDYTLVLATYFPRKGTGISNFRMKDWVQTWNQDHLFPHFLMFGSLDFEHYFKQGFSELEELADRNLISGVKIYPGYQKVDMNLLEKEILPFCVQNNLPIMFHTGDCTGMNGVYAEVSEFDGLVEKFPETPFMFSHLANPKISKIIHRAIRYPNVYTDMSGLIHSAHDRHEIPSAIDNVKLFYDSCGIDKLMFGTDFPVQTHDDSSFMAEKALGNLSQEEKNKFYFGTAARLLGIV